MARDCNEIGKRYVVGGGTSHAQSVFFPDVQGPVKVGVFGASGFSREVADILNPFADELVYIDLNPETTRYFGKPVVNETKIPQLKEQGFLFVIGAGDNTTRQKIFNRYPDLLFPNIVHPTASMGHGQLERLQMKKGNIITAGVRFTNNIEWGDFGIFNLNCTVGHDCIIQDFVNIAPGANISGNVWIEQGAYIGTNAAVLQGKSAENKIRIGKFSVVGAGAVVTKDVNDNATVVGIPAKSIHRLNPIIKACL
jgi:sugar O-acyltransferase (sialic acid O-acetyltransferase NeuD family)